MPKNKTRVFRLEGKVQHYEWGGKTFLPELLHQANPDQKPFAEFWMGAHPRASAELIGAKGEKISLVEFIRSDPRASLGEEVFARFGTLPYLFKVLDVRDMLSIQVHPSKKNAVAGFARENALGIPIGAPERNYKDDNHKPELMVALSEFWLLHGFKKKEDLQRVLAGEEAFHSLRGYFEEGNYENLYRKVMKMDQEEVDAMLGPLLNRIIPLYQEGKLNKAAEDFWAARAALHFNKAGHIDRGIFSIYFFNLLRLEAGEAIYQGAGQPHAYLEGQNMELMANSDNVLRAGLSAKHIDVAELMKQVVFEETIPRILHPKAISGQLGEYETPAGDFSLRQITLTSRQQLEIKTASLEIFFVYRGRVEISENGEGQWAAGAGEAFASLAGAVFAIKAQDDTLIYAAAVGKTA